MLEGARLSHANSNSRDLRREACDYFGLEYTTKTLLVTGGSQGALSINTALFGAFNLLKGKPLQVLHLVGETKLSDATKMIKSLNSAEGIVWKVVGYTDRMDLAYASADLCLCRAGASTISQLAV